MDELKGYVADLQSADVQDNARFQELLVRGMHLLQLFDNDIAREFGVSRPTVTRWRNGDNAPHPAMRRPVYAYLADRSTALHRKAQRVSSAA